MTSEDLNKTTESRAVEPVLATVIGTGDGARLPPSTLAVTDGQHLPNVQVEMVQPALAIVVRFANNYLTALVGLITAGMTPAGGKLLYTSDFYHLVLTCASLALAGPALSFFKDLVTIFGRLEGKFPLLTGSV